MITSAADATTIVDLVTGSAKMVALVAQVAGVNLAKTVGIAECACIHHRHHLCHLLLNYARAWGMGWDTRRICIHMKAYTHQMETVECAPIIVEEMRTDIH